MGPLSSCVQDLTLDQVDPRQRDVNSNLVGKGPVALGSVSVNHILDTLSDQRSGSDCAWVLISLDHDLFFSPNSFFHP